MHLQLNIKRNEFFLLLHIIIVILIMSGLGCSIGYSAVVLPVLASNTTSITLAETEIPLFASIPFAGHLVGALLGILFDGLQRRSGIIIISTLTILGWVVIISSNSVTQLLIGRMITGFCNGLSAFFTTMYIYEIALPTWKEPITVFAVLCYNFGILFVYVLGYIIRNDWRLVAILSTIVPILSLFCTYFFLTESPLFLVMKGQKEAARLALLRLRGLQGRPETAEFQKEFDEIVHYYKKRNNNESPKEEIMPLLLRIRKKLNNFVKAACLPEVWKPVMISSTYIIFQQFCGINVIIAYAVNIIIDVNIAVDPFLVTVFIGIVNLGTGFICVYCSTRVGRRFIAITSSVGVSIFMCGLTLYIHFLTTGYVAIPLVCILGCMIFGTFGFTILPVVMTMEMSPIRYLSVIGPMHSLLLNMLHFINVQLYPMMVKQNKLATMYFFCAISVLATIFLMTVLPETRGKSNAEMEEKFRGKSSIES